MPLFRSGFLVLSLTALVVCAPPVASQTPGRGPILLELPPDAQTGAMGGAFHVSGSSSHALFMAPGVLFRSRGVQGGVQRYGSGATLLGVSGAAEWWGGGVALGLRVLTWRAESAEIGRLTGDPGLLQEGGSTDVGEIAATVGWGGRFGPLLVGLAGSYVEQRVEGSRDTGPSYDVGVALPITFGPGFGGPGSVMLALSGRNLGPVLDLPGGDLPLPARAELAASFRGWWVGPLDLGAAGRVSVLADGTVLPGGGLEVAYWPVRGRTFIVRAGLQRSHRGRGEPLTLGAAFEGDAIVLEYAWRGFDGLDPVHRFGIGWR